MSGEKHGYVDVTGHPQPLGKEEEARAESSRALDEGGTPPPQYAGPAGGDLQASSLSDEVSAGIQYLSAGDPDEIIAVPMIHSTEEQSFKTLILRKKAKVTRTVIIRKMPRSHYLKHYAKDAEGNYVGTEKPAVDAGLVFVLSKSTPEDMLEQVRKVAFGKLHYVDGRFAAVGLFATGGV